MDMFIQQQKSKEVARSSTPCRKGAKHGVKKVNDGQDICSRVSTFGNGKHCQKQAQYSQG